MRARRRCFFALKEWVAIRVTYEAAARLQAAYRGRRDRKRCRGLRAEKARVEGILAKAFGRGAAKTWQLRWFIVDASGARSVADRDAKDKRPLVYQLHRTDAACEAAKRQLSAKKEALVEVDSVVPGVDLSERLTRAKFEELNRRVVVGELRQPEYEDELGTLMSINGCPYENGLWRCREHRSTNAGTTTTEDDE